MSWRGKRSAGLDQQSEEASQPFDGLRVRGPSEEFTPNNATRGSPHYVNSGAYMCRIQFHEHYKKLAIQLTLVGLTKESVPLSATDGRIEFLVYARTIIRWYPSEAPSIFLVKRNSVFFTGDVTRIHLVSFIRR